MRNLRQANCNAKHYSSWRIPNKNGLNSKSKRHQQYRQKRKTNRDFWKEPANHANLRETPGQNQLCPEETNSRLHAE